MLIGNFVQLEPLQLHHVDELAAASAADPSLYQWSPVPQGAAAAAIYVRTALSWREAGTAFPFVILRKEDNKIIGSTRFWNLEHWQWPEGHIRHGRQHPDACEIGYTWLTASAIRTAANTEAKFLLLSHAFEKWQVLRVCLHTDLRNKRSQTAIERIGGRREGVLRSHRMAADFTPRDSVRYSILESEWPEVRTRFNDLLRR